MPGMALRPVEPKHEAVPDAAVPPSPLATDTGDRPPPPGKEPEGTEQNRSHHVPRPSERFRATPPVTPLAGQPLRSARAGSISPTSEARARSTSPVKPDSPNNASPPPRENKSLKQTLDELSNELSALAPSVADTIVPPVPPKDEEVNAQAKPQPVIPKTSGQPPPKRQIPSPLKSERLPRDETPRVRSSGASPTSGPTSAKPDESQPSSDTAQSFPVKHQMFPRKAGRSTPSPASPSPGSASPAREAELSPSAEYKSRQEKLHSPSEQKKPPSPQKSSPTGAAEVRALPKSPLERALASASAEGARSAEQEDTPGIKDNEGVGVSAVENAANGEAGKEKETSLTEESDEQNGDASEKSRTETEGKDQRLASPGEGAGENERPAPEDEAKGEPPTSDAESELTGGTAATSPSTNDVKRLSHLTKSRPGAPKNRRPISTSIANAAASNDPEENEKKTKEDDLSSDENRESPTRDEIPKGASAPPAPAAAPGKPKTLLGRFPTPLAMAGGVPPILRSTSGASRASADVAALRAQQKSPLLPEQQQQQQQATNAVKSISTSAPNLSEVEPGVSSSPAPAAPATPADGASSSDFAAFRKEMEQKMTASRKEIEQKIAEERAARRKLEAEVRELRLLMQVRVFRNLKISRRGRTHHLVPRVS
ncbi:MAG: hypothetical protein BJ554DRAFT_5610 [Olpidium bornovanus]|uniref:Uncharacterized protein n=1 Tax=Olpidium bornovanus TaxID=278681 RepID=A0A8H8DKV9_9FUNG|nr:MAG: hypothetical protein BJ554DRAFT_5610 [Olpidium bornovanus]